MAAAAHDTTARVHKDLRNIARDLVENGCTFVSHGNRIEIVDPKGQRTGHTLTSAAAKKALSISITRKRLENAGLLVTVDELQVRRRRREAVPTPVETAFREAAERKGTREKTPDESTSRSTVPHDALTPERSERVPKKVGIIRPFDGRRSPAPSMRYIGNAAWGDHVVRRLTKHMGEFKTKREFAEFAVEVAKDRRIPPPNTRRGASRDPWDIVRIADVLSHLIERRNARSLTLQFFSAACDELEGVPGGSYFVKKDDEVEERDVIEPGDEGRVVGVEVFAEEDDVVPSAPPAPQEDTRLPQESPEPSPNGDHRQRLAEILLSKLEAGEQVDEALVDRIERLIGE
jgi:hypothetical protein